MRSNVDELNFNQSVQKLFRASVAPVVPVEASTPWKSTFNDGVCNEVLQTLNVNIVILYVLNLFV